MEKVRLNKKKCQQGLDGMNLELILGLENEHLYLPLEELKNEAGNTIVSLECIGGKVTAYVNAVHCIRPNNVKPFGIADAINPQRWGWQTVPSLNRKGCTLFAAGSRGASRGRPCTLNRKGCTLFAAGNIHLSRPGRKFCVK